MFRATLTFLIVLGTLSAACSGTARRNGDAQTPASAAPFLPAVTVEPLEGGLPRPLPELVTGRVAVIDLWATWCTACRDVSKNVELLAEAHKGKAFIAVGLNVGEGRGVVGPFLEGVPSKIPIYLDDQFRVADALQAREVPTILVVDKTGRIRLVKKKVDTEVIRLVEDLLSAP